MKGLYFHPEQGLTFAELDENNLTTINGPARETADINATWLWSPGFTDLYAFLPDPGYEYRENRESFARAARMGGFSTVLCRPETLPVIDNAELAQKFLGKTQGVTLLPMPSFSMEGKHQRLAELGDMAAAGVIAVTNGEGPVASDAFLRRVMEYAANFGLLVVLTPYHSEFNGGLINEGPVSARLGMSVNPQAGEAITIYRYLALAELTNARIHIAKVSTAKGVHLIRQARQRGVNVSASAAFYHLVLTDEAMINLDPNLIVNPPLRSETDRQALLAGIRDHTIDAIVSDHVAVASHEKEMELRFVQPGMRGLELVFPVLLQLVTQGELSLTDLLYSLVTGPQKVLGIHSQGLIRLDLTKDFTPRGTQTNNSPFTKQKLKGEIQWVTGH